MALRDVGDLRFEFLRLVATIRVIFFRQTIGAFFLVGHVLPGNAASLRLRDDDFLEIDRKLFASDDHFREFCEGREVVFLNLEVLLADAGTDREIDVLRRGSESDQGIDSFRDDAADDASPSAVRQSDNTRFLVFEIHRKAIGSREGQHDVGFFRDERVRIEDEARRRMIDDRDIRAMRQVGGDDIAFGQSARGEESFPVLDIFHRKSVRRQIHRPVFSRGISFECLNHILLSLAQCPAAVNDDHLSTPLFLSF